jgi:NAD(P)-dependent dehydrogenase (short-subunit alcohol dehydrogenase family)
LVTPDGGEVAVVTGSPLNIGRATVLHFAREGLSILVMARRAEHDAVETARQVGEADSGAEGRDRSSTWAGYRRMPAPRDALTR